jgi:hypothetical protein
MLKLIVSTPVRRNAVPADDTVTWITALLCWLIAGCVAVICVPALRGSDPLVGWLPFWLIVAPALDLLVLRRRWIVASARACFLHFRARRNSLRRQARSWRGRGGVRRLPAAVIPATVSSQSVMPRRLRSMRRRNSPMMRR